VTSLINGLGDAKLSVRLSIKLEFGKQGKDRRFNPIMSLAFGNSNLQKCCAGRGMLNPLKHPK
jgi:hypothetical protein